MSEVEISALQQMRRGSVCWCVYG